MWLSFPIYRNHFYESESQNLNLQRTAIFRNTLWVLSTASLVSLFVPLFPQQGGKGSVCSLPWFPTSSRIIVTNNPWLRLVLTMMTTALILVMAVFNMVRSMCRSTVAFLVPALVVSVCSCGKKQVWGYLNSVHQVLRLFWDVQKRLNFQIPDFLGRFL